MNNTYSAVIKVGSGQQKVTIQAKDLYTAKSMLNSMYGIGNVINVHQPG